MIKFNSLRDLNIENTEIIEKHRKHKLMQHKEKLTRRNTETKNWKEKCHNVQIFLGPLF